MVDNGFPMFWWIWWFIVALVVYAVLAIWFWWAGRRHDLAVAPAAMPSNKDEAPHKEPQRAR
jgi:hypothetical protein